MGKIRKIVKAIRTCSACGGRGKIPTWRGYDKHGRLTLGGYHTCPGCGGKGRII